MLSKNNRQERERKLEEKNNRFSIRKFTVGAASVLIGAFFIGVSGTQTAHAAEVTPATEQTSKASTETSDAAKKANQSVALDNKAAVSATEKTPAVAAKQVKADTQTVQSEFDQAAKNPGKPANADNTALNNASDAELNEMANLYNSSVAQHSNPNPAQSQSEKDGNPYVPLDQAYSDPKAYIGNADEMPKGTKYTWITSQSDLSKMLMEPGQHKVSILVTFPDGSTKTVTGNYLNVTGSNVQTVTTTQGSDASSISINDAVTNISPVANQWDPQSAHWTILPDTSVAGVTMGQAEVVYPTGNEQPVIIPVRVTPAPTQDVSDTVREEIDVHMPDSKEGSNDYYYKTITKQEMNGKETAGDYTWNPISFDAQSLDSVLAGKDFTFADTGLRNYSLPKVDGYVPKITTVITADGKGLEAGSKPGVDLLAELDEKIAANPYEIPAYTTNYPVSVIFHVTYEAVPTTTPVSDKVYQEITVRMPDDSSYYWKDINYQNMTGEKSSDGTETWNSVSYNAQSVDSVLADQGFTYNKTGYKQTLPTVDGYTATITGVQVLGGTTNDPHAAALLAELDKKVAANPYEIPAYSTNYPFSVGFQVTYVPTKSSTTGDPLVQPDLPPYEGGVPGIPETQPDLPVAPLPEEPETPTTPSDNNNNVPGQPVDTNEGTVAPHLTENPDNGDNSVETPVVHATEAVKADNTDNGVTAPVHAAVAHNDEKKENTLPQTGAKAGIAGMLGVMLVTVGAILGLAVTKKRKN